MSLCDDPAAAALLLIFASDDDPCVTIPRGGQSLVSTIHSPRPLAGQQEATPGIVSRYLVIYSAAYDDNNIDHPVVLGRWWWYKRAAINVFAVASFRNRDKNSRIRLINSSRTFFTLVLNNLFPTFELCI